MPNAFVSAWLGKLLEQDGHDLGRANRQKFLIDSKEEYLCACELEKWAARGRIDFWVRNLVRKPCSSFYLQTAEGRFYPDFVCRLPDKTILVVEYKGADRYAAAKMDRDMGELWAELSDGKCRFVMATDRKWGQIEGMLK